MELNIENQKQEFLTICRASIRREGLWPMKRRHSCWNDKEGSELGQYILL